jgi:hypothetical protein
MPPSAPPTRTPERLAELVSAAAYGTVLVLAALASVGVWQIDVGYGLELVAGVGLATWVAHLFAELLGDHLRRVEPLTAGEVVRSMVDGGPILAAPVLPACALALGQTDVMADATARGTAIALAVAQMLGLGLVAGRVVAARPGGAWLFALATVGVGVGVVGLTVRLGH